MSVDPSKLINHMNHSVIVTDEDMQIIFMTPSAEALLAISRRKAANFKLSALPVAQDEHLGTYLKAVLNSGQATTYRELQISIPEQKRSVTVDCTISVIQNSKSHLMIELASLDRIMRIAKEDQLITQQQASREVVRGMAHEIKNPLGGIRGAAQLLARELDSEQQELTQIIISEVDRLQSLVDRMLGPNRPPQKQAHNIHDLLEHVINLVKVETDNQLRFVKDYDPSLPLLMIDRDQILQAILNIVRNAWEATGSDGCITVKTRALRRFTIGHTQHRLVLALYIIDNGPGIPAHLLEQIFYPMVTGRSDGTGLGLAISQSLINQHNGLIECESEPGKTQFIIYFPIESTEVQP